MIKYSIQYLKSENTIIINRKFMLKKIVILPSEYKSFKKSCSDIDKFENQEIEILK